jgi:transcriptional regulator with XRE-family HTH domain
MFSKEQFGKRVYETRRLHHETQKDLGEAIGMSSNNVSEIEKGKKTTTSEKIAKICRHYHVSADYLLGLSDDPQGGCERWTGEDAQ